MRFSVVSPVFDSAPDYPEAVRAMFTAESLIAHHPAVGEVVFVDNNPDPKSPLKTFCDGAGGRVRYVPYPSPQGNMAAKNEAVRQARCEYVTVIDCHVLLYAGFFDALEAFYRDRGFGCRDLIQGPMMANAGGVYGTHFNDQWRGDTWGTWGRAWQAPSGRLFSVVTLEADKTAYAKLGDDVWDDEALDPAAEGMPPPPPFHGHEQKLLEAGCRPYLDAPFQIRGTGMGFFACRKDSWLPFRADAERFGAEEMTTGRRYRRAGRNVWCVPGAKWWHYFRPGAAPYKALTWDKVRNYVGDFKELGLDVAPIKATFVPKYMPPGEWEQLLAGAAWPAAGAGVAPPPVAPPPVAPPPVAPPPVAPPPAPEATTTVPPADSQVAIHNPRSPLSPLPPYTEAEKDALKQMASAVGPGLIGVEIRGYVGQPQSAATALSTAGAGVLVTIAPAPEPPDGNLGQFVHKTLTVAGRIEALPESCDVLLIDQPPYTGHVVYELLTRFSHKSRRFVAVRGTTMFEANRNLSPDPAAKPQPNGIVLGVRAFAKAHPEWTTVAVVRDGMGLTVMSRDDRDKTQPPGMLAKAMNFAKALARHTANGMEADEAERNRRLEVCVLCPERYHDVCGLCGCPLTKKALWKSETCPANPPKW